LAQNLDRRLVENQSKSQSTAKNHQKTQKIQGMFEPEKNQCFLKNLEYMAMLISLDRHF